MNFDLRGGEEKRTLPVLWLIIFSSATLPFHTTTNDRRHDEKSGGRDAA